MSLSSRGRRWLVLAALVVIASCLPARAEDAVGAEPAAVAATPTPPFWVAGVVITSSKRSAVLVLLDEARREVGATTVREGESISGYRLAAVEAGRVLLEQDGVQFPVPVGRPHTGAKGASDAHSRGRLTPVFIPGPDKPTPEFEYTGPQVNRGLQPAPPDGGAAGPQQEAVPDLLQRLLDNPQFQQRIEERRSTMQQRMERARPDNQAPPESPAATAKQPQRTPQ